MKIMTGPIALLAVCISCLGLPPAAAQVSPIVIGVEVSPSAYPLGARVPIVVSLCNPTAAPVTHYDACGGGCLFDVFIETEAGETVAQKGTVGPAVILPITWPANKCLYFRDFWDQHQEFHFHTGGAHSGPLLPAGTYRARLEALYHPPPSPAVQRSAPFQTSVTVAVPTLMPAGLAGLALVLAGAAFVVLRYRE